MIESGGTTAPDKDATSAQRTIENIAQALRKGTSVDVTSAQKRIESRQFKGRDLA